MPYPPAIQFETMRRAVKDELALPTASESARRAPRRLDRRMRMAGRTMSRQQAAVIEATEADPFAFSPGSVSDEVKRLQAGFVLTGYRSWY